VALAALVALACRDSTPARVGIVMSSDGRTGATFAAADIAAQAREGGAPPLDVRIESLEGASPASPSIAVAERLAEDPSTIAVVGHSNSATSLAASQIYNRRRVPQIAPTTTAPLYGSAGPYSFRLVPDDSSQAVFIAGIVAKRGGVVVVGYVNDDYGRGLWSALRAELQRRGVTVADALPYLEAQDTTAINSIADGVLVRRPAQLVWLGRSAQLGAVLDRVRPWLPALSVLGSDGVEAERLYATPERFAGLRFVRFINPGDRRPELQAFRRRFRDSVDRELTAEAVLSYDAVMLIEAARRSGARSRDDVRTFLTSLGRSRPPFAGVSGPIAFDARGAVERRHLLAEVTDRGVRGVDP
jgi:branched-chain amino acid transport system substrate-binding protein